jgi:hypothetical protein
VEKKVKGGRAGGMDKELLKEFMNEEVIPLRAKFDDYLAVALDIRRASQFISPAELPDASILGATIDDRFTKKMAGRKLPGESLGQFMKGKMGKFWRRSRMQEIRYRLAAIREIYKDVVENAHSYQTYIKWASKLGLSYKELESRPTIREIYLFKDPKVAEELDELQELRKDIRWEKMRTAGGAQPAYTKAFPEEMNPAYLKKLGRILGFPICCIERYTFDRESAVLTPEQRAANQLSDLEGSEEYDLYAYFTKDFFPCQPDCETARDLGKAMYDRLLEIDPEIAERYAKHLENNVALVRQYPEIIRQKIEALERIAGKHEEGDEVEDQQ